MSEKIWLIVALIAVITALLRFLPFILFSNNKKTPKIIDKLSRVLPYAIMAMLVVYCLKDVKFDSPGGFVPYSIASVIVVISYIWKRNTLVSIITGTICYMLLVQLVF